MKTRFLILILVLIAESLFAQAPDTSFKLDFNVKAKRLIGGGFELTNKKLIKEFTIQGKATAKYRIEIKSDSFSIISKFENNKWLCIDTIKHSFYMRDTNDLFIPSFYVEDFNKDGNQDLLCWVLSGMSMVWTMVYLNDPLTKTLEKLKNAAENSYHWDNPEYNLKDSTIHCARISSNWELSFNSKYKLVNFTAIPLEKDEIDNTQMDYSGKGSVTRHYVGKNGKWELTKEIKN